MSLHAGLERHNVNKYRVFILPELFLQLLPDMNGKISQIDNPLYTLLTAL